MSHAENKKTRRVSLVEILGELFVTAGVILLLFVFYEAYWTNIAAGQKQDQAEKQLEQTWDADDQQPQEEQQRHFHAPELGEAFARMYVPSFGSDYQFAIVEGTSEEDLLKGPGRYVDSQMPGQPGNFAVAGHRVGKGAPFNDLGLLKTCDTVVVETRTAWNIYRVLPVDSTNPQQRFKEAEQCLSKKQAEEIANGKYKHIPGRRITVPGDIGVIDAVPEEKVEPSKDDEALMTMTTCHPQFSNKQRMIIHAMLERSEPKVKGHKPKEMEQH